MTPGRPLGAANAPRAATEEEQLMHLVFTVQPNKAWAEWIQSCISQKDNIDGRSVTGCRLQAPA